LFNLKKEFTMTAPHTPSTLMSDSSGAVSHAMNSAAQSAQNAASSATGQAQQTLHSLLHEMSPALSRMADQLTHLSRHGISAMEHSGHQVSHQIHHASDRTLGYIRNEPVKSVLVAVAVGAALMTALSVFSRSSGPH
jgi:ElaB/YqjD/DUF883 family membrane-anchored ribosome-binding protein